MVEGKRVNQSLQKNTLSSLPKVKGVWYATNPLEDQFEVTYYNLRDREGRIYDDKDCANLPAVEMGHRHHKEWSIRQFSADILIDNIKRNGKNESILDIGCGNGWLSSYLQNQVNCQVVGLDRNVAELEQAARVFIQENLCFVYGDVFHMPFSKECFDVIVLAASCQYFANFSRLIRTLIPYLSLTGSIYIVDTPFYSSVSEAQEAKERSHFYYKSNEAEVLLDHYHHHLWSQLDEFNSEVIYNPHSLFNRLKRKFIPHLSPFPLIKIKSRSESND